MCILSGLPRQLSSKESLCQYRRLGFYPWVRKILWRRKWQPTPVFLSGKFHGQRNLEGYSLWDHNESDMTERVHTHTHTHTHTYLCFQVGKTDKYYINFIGIHFQVGKCKANILNSYSFFFHLFRGHVYRIISI